ncbi:MAG: nitrilase, partial [Anaerolineae bacterium]|nr:nitrilase [Anaerolineae bacterium]
LAPRGLDSPAAFRWVAEQGDRVAEFLNARAREHQLYIIGGSTARIVDGQLRNVAYLHTPSGRRYEQDKLHITPHEREIWGVRPGQLLRVFDSPHGRFAIQICYDIEFPEVSRILALAGAEVIFVPFATDGPAAYNRVRFAAQARAVENSIYVVLSGNAGSLPTRDYMLHYAR